MVSNRIKGPRAADSYHCSVFLTFLRRTQAHVGANKILRFNDFDLFEQATCDPLTA